MHAKTFTYIKEPIKVSQKHTYTTSDYMEWSTMLNLVRRLYRDGYFRISLLVGCGCFFGLRISDLLSLTWEMLLEGDSFMIQEKKTGKRRIIRINPNFRMHIEDCFNALDIRDKSEKCFLSKKKVVYSIQRINVILKEIRERYNLKIEHFSTHTFRKTFGRQVVEQSGDNSEMALINYLSYSIIQVLKLQGGI